MTTSDRDADFLRQQLLLLHDLPVYETIEEDIELIIDEHRGEEEVPSIPSEHSIRRAVKKANDAIRDSFHVRHTPEARRVAIAQLAGVRADLPATISLDDIMGPDALPRTWAHDTTVTEVQRRTYKELRAKVVQLQRRAHSLKIERDRLAQLASTSNRMQRIAMDADAVQDTAETIAQSSRLVDALHATLRDPAKREQLKEKLRTQRKGPQGSSASSMDTNKKAKLTAAAFFENSEAKQTSKSNSNNSNNSS